LILINLFINVKKFANFLDNFLKRRSEMDVIVWFYFTIIINVVIGFATYYASKRDRKKRINEYKKTQDDELERIRNKFNL